MLNASPVSHFLFQGAEFFAYLKNFLELMNKANSSPVFSVRGCGSLLVCTVIYNNLKIIYILPYLEN
jgi:hypothetical protein